MSSLVSGISATDKVFEVDTAFTTSARYPVPITIGSEHMTLDARRPNHDGTANTVLQVTRGLDGTTPAAHLAGASITAGWGSGGGSIAATDGTTTVSPATSIQFPTGTLSDLGGGVAGVGLVFHQIGPFGIDFDDDAIGDGIGLVDLGSGQLVFAAWVYVTTPFVNGVTPTFASLAIGDPNGSTFNIGYYHADSSGVHTGVTISGTSDEGVNAGQLVGNLPHPALVTGGGQQLVSWIDGGPCTTGHADIYAIIATPAA